MSNQDSEWRDVGPTSDYRHDRYTHWQDVGQSYSDTTVSFQQPKFYQPYNTVVPVLPNLPPHSADALRLSAALINVPSFEKTTLETSENTNVAESMAENTPVVEVVPDDASTSGDEENVHVIGC